MALIDTAPVTSDLENRFRMACADELGAQTLYRELRNTVYHREEIPSHIKEDLIRRLDEIIKDEEEHTGSLLFCLNLLNPDIARNMDNGAKGA
jgi:rubrerythrin